MTRPFTAIAALVLVLPASIAAAQGSYQSPTDDRLAISLGVMQVDAATQLRVDPDGGSLGTQLDAENDLGLDKRRYEPKFEAWIRAGERHRLFFDYFTFDRSATKVLALPPVNYGEVVLLTGDPVQTDLSMRILGVTYGYSLWHGETFELSGLIGINDTEITSSVRVQTPTRHIYDSQSLAGPYPTPGIAATWVASERFYFDASGKYLRVAVDNLSAAVGIYEFAAHYRLRPNVAFALGYNAIKADLTSNQHNNAGHFDFDAQGPELFVRVSF